MFKYTAQDFISDMFDDGMTYDDILAALNDEKEKRKAKEQKKLNEEYEKLLDEISAAREKLVDAYEVWQALVMGKNDTDTNSFVKSLNLVEKAYLKKKKQTIDGGVTSRVRKVVTDINGDKKIYDSLSDEEFSKLIKKYFM